MPAYNKGDEPIPNFRLLQFLGRGGFGEVWKAVGPGGTQLALKIISLSDHHGLKEFRAIRLVKNVKHANLVPIFGIWAKDEDGRVLEDSAADNSVNLKKRSAAELILAMGLGEKSLAQRLKECKKENLPGIPLRELLRYFTHAADAIDFLNDPCHETDSGPVAIQHGDIKPHNILIVGGAAKAGGGAQVCDFGLARLLDNVRSTSTMAAFSPAYVAPENLPPEYQPHRTSDQYSLAISYVELRTGQLPFEARNPYEAVEIQKTGRLDLGRLSPAEQTVIRQATALDPTRRFPSCGEMVRALQRAADSLTKTPGSGVYSAVSLEQVHAGVTLVPHHRLVRLLGRGGYGEVWEAVASGGIACALKVVRALDAAKGKQEFRALGLIKDLEHDHLLPLQAFWLLDSLGEVIPEDRWHEPDAPAARMLVVRTPLAAKNLLQRLTECQDRGLPGIPPDELLGYVRQAADALDYLNSEHDLPDGRLSIQHRDIKPENLLLTRAGKVKVSDFGLAKLLGGTSATINSQSQGMSLPYAAPEVFHGKVSRWTDQYSLAITYYKLRTGELPFSANLSYIDRALVHSRGNFDLGRVAEPERSVLARATSERPEERYPSCLAFVNELQTALGVPLSSPPVSVALSSSLPSHAPAEIRRAAVATEEQPKALTMAPRVVPNTDQPSETIAPPPAGSDSSVPPEDLASTIWANYPEESKKKRRLRLIGWVLGILAAIGLVLLALHFLPNRAGTQEEGKGSDKKSESRIYKETLALRRLA
jgi:serine/threonine protein kinase